MQQPDESLNNEQSSSPDAYTAANSERLSTEQEGRETIEAANTVSIEARQKEPETASTTPIEEKQDIEGATTPLLPAATSLAGIPLAPKPEQVSEIAEPDALVTPTDKLPRVLQDSEALNASASASSSTTRPAIPHRPHARHIQLPAALESTLRNTESTLRSTVKKLTGQVQAIRHIHQQPTAQLPFSERTGTQELPPPPWRRPVGPAHTVGAEQPPLPTQALQPIRATATALAPEKSAELRVRPERTVAGPWKRSRATRIAWMMRQHRERNNTRARRRQRIRTIVLSILAAIVIILISSGLGYSYAYYQSQLPRLQSLANEQIDQSTRIYDRSGSLLYTLYSSAGRSTPVSYAELPGFLQDAMIAAEDPTFWTNVGVDPAGILRAFDQYESAGGQFQSGGSTITQQLIKNLSNDRQLTWQRKITEATLAIGLTREYPKWKILEMYFNSSPFGAQEVGVEAATEDFFGLKPKCTSNFDCIPAVAFLDRDNTSAQCSSPRVTYNGVSYAEDDSTCPVNVLLGLARASFLAGMPQNPVIFDPTAYPQNIPLALGRQDYVLQQMLADKMQVNVGLGSQVKDVMTITPSLIQQVEAITQKFKFMGFQNTEVAPSFVSWIIQDVANALGDDQDLVNGISVPGLNILNTAGLNIRTTLDSNLEKYVENAITRHITEPENQEYVGYETLSQDDNLHDSAAVVIDAKTGEVLALDGSANWNDTSAAGSGQVNMALTPRQPGSSFKPIALAAAYQMGFYPGIVLPDYETYFPTSNDQSLSVNATGSNVYAPPDYGGTWHDINSNIELAISNSFNIPALKTEYFAGLQNVYDMAARLGITSIDPKTGIVPSMVLGTEAVSLLQMTDAYQAFADQGLHIEPQGVLDIWDNYGRQLYHYDPSHPAAVRVISPQVAFLVTSTLDNQAARAIEFPGDTLLTMNHWTLADGTHPEVAAKTGTTDSFRDNWTIGYTPDVVVGVWSGNADDEPMVNSIGITGAAPIWDSIMYYASGYCNKAYDQISCPTYDLGQTVGTARTFAVPSGIIQQEVNTYTGLAGSGYDTYMIDGDQPSTSGIDLSNTSSTSSTPGHGHHSGR